MAGLPKIGAPTGGTLRILGLVLAGALVIAAVVSFRGGSDAQTVTANFPRTVSVYEGSDVRVLGVAVGQIDEIKPVGTSVQVTMTINDDVDLPEDVKAVIVSPSVVGDRYIQMTPAYVSGPKLESGAKIGLDRTGMPLELDDIYQSIDDLVVGLGPDGANSEGALTRLLKTTARNFKGQGKKFNTTIKNVSLFTSTLDNNKEALFGAAEEINRFVSTLAQNDQTVRDFNDSLAAASDVLEGERQDLAAALENLGVATKAVSGFVKENRDGLSKNIKGLVRVAETFAKRRNELDEILTAGPTAISNLFHTYNKSSGTLDTRSNFGENFESLESNPSATLCSLVGTVDNNGDLCNSFEDLLGRAGVDGVGSKKSKKAQSKREYAPIAYEYVDRSLGGLTEVAR